MESVYRRSIDTSSDTGSFEFSGLVITFTIVGLLSPDHCVCCRHGDYRPVWCQDTSDCGQVDRITIFLSYL